jgi:hypothetical protein
VIRLPAGAALAKDLAHLRRMFPKQLIVERM